MNPAETLTSGFGSWTPLVWLAAFGILSVIGLIIRRFGSNARKPGTQQGKPFLSGLEETDVHQLHVRGENLYWGFLEALQGYYQRLVPLHSGHIVDYLLWFFAVLIVFLIAGLMK